MKYLKENVSDWICQDAIYVKGIFVDEYYELNSNGETVYSVMLELANGHRVTIKDFYYPEDACTFADSEYEKWLKERNNQQENHNVVHDTYSKQPKQVGS